MIKHLLNARNAKASQRPRVPMHSSIMEFTASKAKVYRNNCKAGYLFERLWLSINASWKEMVIDFSLIACIVVYLRLLSLPG